MMANAFRQKLSSGELVCGIATAFAAPAIIECIGEGWDFIWIDAQHGLLSREDVLHAVRVCERMGLGTLVRTPGQEYGILGPFADLAPDAMMIPMVNSAAQAKEVVRCLRFAPLGERSYGGLRAILVQGRAYHQENTPVVLVQIEHPDALGALDDIAGTEGVDGLFLGPADMRLGMGLSLETPAEDSPEMQRVMADVVEAARRHGKFAGCVSKTVKGIRMLADLGYQLIAVGGDAGFLRVGSEAAKQTCREAGVL